MGLFIDKPLGGHGANGRPTGFGRPFGVEESGGNGDPVPLPYLWICR